MRSKKSAILAKPAIIGFTSPDDEGYTKQAQGRPAVGEKPARDSQRDLSLCIIANEIEPRKPVRRALA